MTPVMTDIEHPYDGDDGSTLTEGEWQGMGFGIAARRHRDEIIAGMMEYMRRTAPEAGQACRS